MKIIEKIACVALFAGVLTGTSVNATASTVKVLKYTTLHSAQYTVTKGAKGYMYKTASLKTKIHNIKNYPKFKFTVSKQVVVRKNNGAKAIYYYAKGTKASGWLWHGSLKKVVKKSSDIEIAALKQQIVDLQQQLNSLKAQSISSSASSVITDDSAIQTQINSLKDQLKNLKVSTTITGNPWSGVSHNYYLFAYQRVTVYKDNQVANDMGSNKGVDTSRVATTVKSTDHQLKIYPDNLINSMYPCEYEGIKGYVQASDVTGINADDSTPQVYLMANALYEANFMPTETSLDTNSIQDGTDWNVYNQDGWASYNWRDGKWNLEEKNNWAGTDFQGEN